MYYDPVRILERVPGVARLLKELDNLPFQQYPKKNSTWLHSQLKCFFKTLRIVFLPLTASQV